MYQVLLPALSSANVLRVRSAPLSRSSMKMSNGTGHYINPWAKSLVTGFQLYFLPDHNPWNQQFSQVSIHLTVHLSGPSFVFFFHVDMMWYSVKVLQKSTWTALNALHWASHIIVEAFQVGRLFPLQKSMMASLSHISVTWSWPTCSSLGLFSCPSWIQQWHLLSFSPWESSHHLLTSHHHHSSPSYKVSKIIKNFSIHIKIKQTNKQKQENQPWSDYLCRIFVIM